MKLHYGAIRSPRARLLTLLFEGCAWCYREHDLTWPANNPSSSICSRHETLLLARLRETRAAAAAAVAPLATPIAEG